MEEIFPGVRSSLLTLTRYSCRQDVRQKVWRIKRSPDGGAKSDNDDSLLASTALACGAEHPRRTRQRSGNTRGWRIKPRQYLVVFSASLTSSGKAGWRLRWKCMKLGRRRVFLSTQKRAFQRNNETATDAIIETSSSCAK